MSGFCSLVDCPDSHRGEWSFHLFDVQVRVKFWFWIAILILGGEQPPVPMFIWISVCFVSILVHEFGHVLAFRMFGEKAEVILYGWGGLAKPRNAVRTFLARFVVALSGPMAGFVLGGLALAALIVMSSSHFGLQMFLPMLSDHSSLAHGIEDAPRMPHYLYLLLVKLLFVNFIWGIVNLLPIYPLDGGEAARALFEQRDPFGGRRKSLILSAVVAAIVALLGLLAGSIYIIILFGVLAASSMQSLESTRRFDRRPYQA